MAQRLTWQNVNAGAEMEDLSIFGPGNLWRRVCLDVTQQRHHVALSHTNLLLFRACYSRRDCKKRRELHITVKTFLGVFLGGGGLPCTVRLKSFSIVPTLFSATHEYPAMSETWTLRSCKLGHKRYSSLQNVTVGSVYLLATVHKGQR